MEVTTSATTRKRLTSCQAIKLKCLACSDDSADKVKHCPVTGCPLHKFRQGHNPNISRKKDDAQPG